jgi:protein-disulfide isomerase
MERSKSTTPIAIVVAALIIGGSIFAVYATRPESAQTTQDATNTASGSGKPSDKVAPITEKDWIMGNPNAPVRVVVFTDFQCPFCKQFHETMERIIDTYGKEGKVAWVYRHFPIAQLHPNAPQLAVAAECAGELGGNTAFWKYANLLFSSGSDAATFDMNQLPVFATEIGINRPLFEQCLADTSLATNVENDFKDALNAGAQGTPYSVIMASGKTYPISGGQPYPAVQAVIEIVLNQTTVTEIKPPSSVTQEDRLPWYGTSTIPTP